MSEYQLNPETILEGYSQHRDGLELFEISHRAIVSLAMPKKVEQALEQSLKQMLGLGLPTVGQWLSYGEGFQFIRLQNDLCFVVFDYLADRAVEVLTDKLVDTLDAELDGVSLDQIYLTAQSDSWVTLRVSGEKGREALARICPIDLHPKVFKPGCVARTMMEHIGVIIICEAQNEYTLMALRSYAKSFLHAIEVSIENTSD